MSFELFVSNNAHAKCGIAFYRNAITLGSLLSSRRDVSSYNAVAMYIDDDKKLLALKFMHETGRSKSTARLRTSNGQVLFTSRSFIRTAIEFGYPTCKTLSVTEQEDGLFVINKEAA